MSRKVRSLVAALALTAFIPGAAQALPWTARPIAPVATGLLEAAWVWVTSLFSPAPASIRQEKWGFLDSGALAENHATGGGAGGGGSEAGMIMDPNGSR